MALSTTIKNQLKSRFSPSNKWLASLLDTTNTDVNAHSTALGTSVPATGFVNGATPRVSATATGTVALALTTASVHRLTLTGNVTFSTPTGVPATGKLGVLTLILTQDGTGSRTVTWFSGIKWTAASATDITATADVTTIYQFVTVDGGTTWFNTLAKADLR